MRTFYLDTYIRGVHVGQVVAWSKGWREYINGLEAVACHVRTEIKYMNLVGGAR